MGKSQLRFDFNRDSVVSGDSVWLLGFDLSPWYLGFDLTWEFSRFDLKIKDFGPKSYYVILRLHHVASLPSLLLLQCSSLVLIATWVKMQCTSHSQLPLTYPNVLDVNTIKWFSNTSTPGCQVSQQFCNFFKRRTLVQCCGRNHSRSSQQTVGLYCGVTVASYTSDWIDSSLITVHILPD